MGYRTHYNFQKYILVLNIVFITLFTSTSSSSQGNQPTDTRFYNETLHSIFDSCLLYRNTDINMYEKHIRSLLLESENNQNKYYEYAGLIELAFLDIINAKYEDAIEKLNVAISKSDKIGETNLVINGLMFKGIAEKEKFQYYNAINTFREVFRLSKIMNRNIYISASSYMLGEIYKSGNDLEEAFKHYQEGKPNSIDEFIYEDQGWWYYNFSDYLLKTGNYEQSIAYCDTSLIVWDHLEMTRGKGYSNNLLGEIYRLTKSPKCVSYYKKALEYNTTMGNKPEILKSLIGLGSYYAENQDDKIEAANWHQEAILFSENNDLTHYSIPALDFFLSHTNLLPKYSLELNELMETKIKSQEVLFRKNSQQEIQLSEAKIELANSINEKQIAKEQANAFKIIIKLLSIIGIIIIGFVFMLFKSKKKITSLNHELSDNLTLLEEQKIQLENTNNTRIKIIERLKKFSSVLSHDLKEPVRTINSFGELIKRNKNKNLSEKEIKYINYMTDGAKRMHDMIITLYKYSNSTLALLNAFSEINLDQLLENVKLDLVTKIQEKRATITSDKLGLIEGQEVLIYQLFQNLISNSLKYSKDNLDTIIQIKSNQLNTEEIQITFQDNGIGIPESEQKGIFDLFRRANNVEENEGNGIGLATCKEIVELHNGKIWLESTIDIGTSIHVVLPIKIINLAKVDSNT